NFCNTRRRYEMLWEIDIHPADEQPDREANRVAEIVRELGVDSRLHILAARGFLLESPTMGQQDVERLAQDLFANTTIEHFVVGHVGEPRLVAAPLSDASSYSLLQVLPKPGVMDPVAQSAEEAVRDYGLDVQSIRTIRKYWIHGASSEELSQIAARVLSNDAIEQVVEGPLPFDQLQLGGDYQFQLQTVPLQGLDDEGLMHLSR